MALRRLNTKLGEIPSPFEARVNKLQITQLDRLIESLLGFSAVADCGRILLPEELTITAVGGGFVGRPRRQQTNRCHPQTV